MQSHCALSDYIYLQDLFHFNNSPDYFIVSGFVSLIVILIDSKGWGTVSPSLLQDAGGETSAVVVGVSVISWSKGRVLH